MVPAVKASTSPRSKLGLVTPALVRFGSGWAKLRQGAAGRVDGEHDRASRAVRDGRDRAGGDDGALEEVEVRADGLVDRGLDGVGVRHGDDHAAGVAGAEPLEAAVHPGLHLLEALA